MDAVPEDATLEEEDFSHTTHAKKLLSQVYYRQNMYVKSAQYNDKLDLNWYLGPQIFVTGFASFLGFLASSSLVADSASTRNMISLASGFLGVMATTITALRNAVKYDVKAEMFRGAAGQYRLLATRLEQKLREHKIAEIKYLKTKKEKYDTMSSEEKTKFETAWEETIEQFDEFFTKNYSVVLTAQAEMKYFPPGDKVREWKKADMLLPNRIDQPEVIELTKEEVEDAVNSMKKDS